jgi:DNA polymerase-3 subunit delta'
MNSDMRSFTTHPAYLCIGDKETVLRSITQELKNIYCLHKGCNSCITCTQIDNRQHHMMLWINPLKSYTLSDLAPLFSKIIYKLPDNEHYFFILQDADRLSQTCANSLLKSLEEPPPGYHFILISSTKQAVISTISSRCMLYTYTYENDKADELLSFMKRPSVDQTRALMSYVDKHQITEHHVMALLDRLHAYWLFTDHAQKDDVISFLCSMRSRSVMPGSTKIALKNIFLYMLTIDDI